MPLYTVFAADRAGNTWDIGTYAEPLTALWVLEAHRSFKPFNAYGVYDKDDPEQGDIQEKLEELLDYDTSFTTIIEAALQETRNAKD